MNKLCCLLIILSLTISTTLFAKRGGDAGNGGGAVVCRDADKKIVYSEVFDLWEWKDLGIVKHEGSVKEILDEVLSDVKEVNKWYFDLLSVEVDYAYKAITKFTDSRPYVGIKKIKDSKHVIKIKSCPNGKKIPAKFEQLVNYMNSGRIYVDSEIYHSLSSLHQAAIIVHEAVYKTYRDLKSDTDSRAARETVAKIFSVDKTLKDLSDNLYKSLYGTMYSKNSIIYNEIVSPVIALFGKDISNTYSIESKINFKKINVALTKEIFLYEEEVKFQFGKKYVSDFIGLDDGFKLTREELVKKMENLDGIKIASLLSNHFKKADSVLNDATILEKVKKMQKRFYYFQGKQVRPNLSFALQEILDHFNLNGDVSQVKEEHGRMSKEDLDLRSIRALSFLSQVLTTFFRNNVSSWKKIVLEKKQIWGTLDEITHKGRVYRGLFADYRVVEAAVYIGNYELFRLSLWPFEKKMNFIKQGVSDLVQLASLSKGNKKDKNKITADLLKLVKR